MIIRDHILTTNDFSYIENINNVPRRTGRNDEEGTGWAFRVRGSKKDGDINILDAEIVNVNFGAVKLYWKKNQSFPKGRWWWFADVRPMMYLVMNTRTGEVFDMEENVEYVKPSMADMMILERAIEDFLKRFRRARKLFAKAHRADS